MGPISWRGADKIGSRSFRCGHCNNAIASESGYFGVDQRTNGTNFIYICHFCSKPTFFDGYNGQQVPGPAVGETIEYLPQDINSLYGEARNCLKVGACTASALSTRKLLMNIAVSKGAKEGEPFVSYVEYLAKNNFIPPGGEEWVTHIRKKGNEANHEIRIFSQEEAEELIKFTEMLLKFIFEFPAIMKNKKGAEKKS